MTRLLMLVEGQSEELFVRRTLKAHLAQYDVYVQPTVLWTKRLPSGGGHQGGVSNWNQILESLLPLTHDGDAWVSTLLDFYGLPDDFPGLPEARCAGDPQEKVTALQNRFAAELNHPRFIPFLALHEFEAWIFSAPDIVEAHFEKTDLANQLRDVVQKADAPERINHGATTHPKARLKELTGRYRETLDAPELLEKIGLARIRAACPHFNDWLTRLEALGKEAL
ncbi:MAG: DUF4276 family protein [Candidatus Accumulibacter sp.]|jgi:hypothetical protein|nr:DUF4276 family protein [Accumulibacter sp.]